MRRIHDTDAGLALSKLLVFIALATPVGVYAFHSVQTAVRNETLRSDIRGAISVEAICNQDKNGSGYAAGSNVAQRGGAFVLDCGGVDETVRASAGNELTVTVGRSGHSFFITGYQRSTGLHLRYDSVTGKWS